MVTEVAVDESASAGLDRKQLQALIDKILPFARTADALARRTVGKVKTLAILGLLSAAWITTACVQTFAWGLGATLSMLLPLLIPAAVLWKIYAVLNSTVGLPQRIVDAANRLFGKASEFRQYYQDRARVQDPIEKKSRFRDMWRTSRSLLEVKALGDEASELVSIAGGALVLTNPLFAIFLFGASALVLVLATVAAIVGLAFIF